MSAATFLKNLGDSNKKGLRDLQSDEAINGARSAYSLPINNGKEMPTYGAYGATDIPVHAIEKLSMSSPLGDSSADIPATR